MPNNRLIKPHGANNLKILLPEDKARNEYAKKAETLPRIPMTSREASDLIMLGIGAFTPLEGFMGYDDWKSVSADMKTADGIFWPIPITLSTKKEIADSIKVNSEAALIDPLTGTAMGIIQVSEKYAIDKIFECKNVFGTEDPEHPGVEKVVSQGDINISGRAVVLHESTYPDEFKGIYQRPAESRKIFEEKGWKTIAALQLRNPMHRSHEFLAKIAIEVSDGLYIHQLLGELKQGDIPADVRVRCINTLVDNYFVKDTVVTGGYPMEMRYAGPREALLHAIFRQNYGCTHLIVGRDHAGVGNYYGPFDAQKIFHQIPENAILTKSLPIDWTFYCYKCQGMASMKTCPHGKEDRLFLSGTALRKGLSEGGEIPEYFSRPEVLEILKEYYRGLTERVEIKTHKYAEGDTSGIRKK